MKKFVRLLMIVSFACTCTRADQLQFDPKDPNSIQAESNRIKEKYKNDPAKCHEEMERFNREVAIAIGKGSEYDRHEELIKKYGSPSAATILIGRNWYDTTTIDNSAWHELVETKGDEISISFYLDKARYQKVVPSNLQIQLRSKGKDAQEELQLSAGRNIEGIMRFNLAYEKTQGQVYKINLVLPPTEREKYVIEISADIEKGWAIHAIVNLASAIPQSPYPDSAMVMLGASFPGKYYDVSKVDAPPKPRFQPSPVYPPALREAKISGEVTLYCMVETDGAVSIRLIKSSTNGGFNQAVLDAVTQWRFEPAKVGGSPVRCLMQVVIPFK